jgi:hypothetical protein
MQIKRIASILIFIIPLIYLVGKASTCHADNLSCRLYDELKGNEDTIVTIAFSPKGTFMASADAKGNILVWDMKDEVKVSKRFVAPFGDEGALIFSQDEQFLFCAGKDKTVQIWNLVDGTKLRDLSMNQPVRSLAISPDGKTLIGGGTKGGITLWDIESGREIKSIKEAHKNGVLFAAFTDQETFRSVGEDRKMKSWDINRSRPLATGIDEMVYEVMATTCNASMDVCAVGTVVVRMKKFHRGVKEFHNIYLKDGISWGRAGTLKGHDLRIHALSFTPQGDYLASGGEGKTVNIWNMKSSQIEADIRYGFKVSALSFSPDGKWLAVGGDNKLVSLYKLKGVPGIKEMPEIMIASEPDLTPGEKYAVVVGLSQFKDPNVTPLKYTVSDAKSFYQFLTSEQGGAFPKKNVLMLSDADATKVNLEDAFKNFLPKNAGKDDTVVLFFAGHGTPDTDLSGRSDDGMEKYLVPYDADLQRIAATCIPMSEFSQIFSSIRSRRVVFFLDTCFSGGSAGKGSTPDVLTRTFCGQQTSTRGLTITSQFINKLTEGPNGYGKVLLTASQANEQALELPELAHGLFTYYLLEGLSGKADNDGDGFVTLKELYDFLEERVAMHSRRSGGKQTPMMAGTITGKIVLSRINNPD